MAHPHPEFDQIVDSARRWLDQERLWDGHVYASSPVAGGAPLPAVRAAPPSLSNEGDLSSRGAALAAVHAQYNECVRCPLGPTRIKFVFGVGHPASKVLFIGEGPGYQEDRLGEPFVGKAGQLLDKMLAAIGLSRRTNAYIANIVKCHPMADPSTPDARGNDRPPTPEEVASCSPILLRQIAVIQPRVIVTLGSPSSKMILRTTEGISKIRGKLFPFPVDAFYPDELPSTLDGDESSLPPRLDSAVRGRLRDIQVLPTYHPAALLRNPNLKGDSWTDLKLLRDTFLQ